MSLQFQGFHEKDKKYFTLTSSNSAQCLDLLLGGVSKPQFQSLWRDFSQNLVVSSTGEWYNLGKIMERHLHRAGVHRGAQGVHKVHIFTNFFVC